MTKKPDLEAKVIMSTLILPYEKGDFGERVDEEEGIMYFPVEVYEALKYVLGGSGNIRNTYSLVSCIVSFPTSFKVVQSKLGWTDEEFKNAEEKLMQTLRQYVPEEYFNWNPPKRTFGAMPPDPSYIGKTPEQLRNMKKN